jgi:3-oxoacyl-[acyl-carrier-protein] synthase III
MRTYAYIKAIASYLPEQIEKNDAADRFIQKIGVFEKHIAAEDETVSDLAVAAAENLFAKYAVDRRDIDFIVLCTQTPDYLMPTTACLVQSRLGLSQACGALDYNLGCSGYAYGLSLIKGLIETEQAKNVLLLTACTYTKYISKEDGTTRPLFGDSATATLVSGREAAKPLLHSFVFGTDGSKYDSLIIPAGGAKNPPHRTPIIEQVDERGNKRTNYEVFMDGQVITYFSLREVPPLVEKILAKAGLQRAEMDYYVFHQANKLMLGFVQKKCKLMDLPFYNDCSMVGNTVSGTIPLALEQIVAKHEVENLRNVMLAGFGVGLSWSGCVADLSEMIKI